MKRLFASVYFTSGLHCHTSYDHGMCAYYLQGCDMISVQADIQLIFFFLFWRCSCKFLDCDLTSEVILFCVHVFE